MQNGCLSWPKLTIHSHEARFNWMKEICFENAIVDESFNECKKKWGVVARN
jgi:hypothetical protein